jgi:stage II sporulation protein D
VYSGLDRARKVPLARLAVRKTTGLVCTWDSPKGERIFCSYYSSSCGGSTQSADAIRRNSAIPPLAGNVACPCCETTDNCHWGPVRLAKTFLTARLRDRYERFSTIGPIDQVEVARATPAGRPVTLLFRDAEGREIELESENFRLTMDPSGRTIRSTFFALVDEGLSISLADGRGFGHGVGMCQHGAEQLARQGQKAGRILKHYYPNSRLKRVY